MYTACLEACCNGAYGSRVLGNKNIREMNEDK
jgi:hypothetical protein